MAANTYGSIRVREESRIPDGREHVWIHTCSGGIPDPGWPRTRMDPYVFGRNPGSRMAANTYGSIRVREEPRIPDGREHVWIHTCSGGTPDPGWPRTRMDPYVFGRNPGSRMAANTYGSIRV